MVGQTKTQIATRTQQRHFGAMLLTSMSPFDVNVVGMSRTEHFVAANWEILDLNQLNYSFFKSI